MNKLTLMLFCLFFILSVQAKDLIIHTLNQKRIISSNEETSIKTNNINKHMLIGGWYPVFFIKYDQAKIDKIISLIKANKVKSIMLTYSITNKKLALEINQAIQSKVNMLIPMEELNISDEDRIKYKYNQVILTVFTN